MFQVKFGVSYARGGVGTPAVNFASNALPWNHGSDVFVTTCFKCASHRWDALQIPGAIDISAKPERITTEKLK